MAGAGLLALLDDIATILDDVAVMSKVAVKKTAGVLGDDLALNAEQVAGVAANREIPVILAVAKGSTVNKAILVPAAIAISLILPWAITPLLMVGGAFLCFEGCEKLAHKLFPDKSEDTDHHKQLLSAVVDPGVDLVAHEKAKIRGAIRTDFILSAEIIVISLGAVAEATLYVRILALCAVAAIMTVGVYGLVAVIVKLDDLGLKLLDRSGDDLPARLSRNVGRRIVLAAPWIMKGLGVAGTAAMFMVGGGILVHGVAPLHHAIEALAASLHPAGAWVEGLARIALEAGIGILAGVLILAVVQLVRRRWVAA